MARNSTTIAYALSKQPITPEAMKDLPMLDVALFTISPDGAKLKSYILETATDQGNMLIQSGRRYWTQEPTFFTFYDITHFFNPDRTEVGMIAFANTVHETALVFSTARRWSPEFLNRCEFRKNVMHPSFRI